MISKLPLLLIAIILGYCSFGTVTAQRIKPHTRLLYDAGGGTNIWFFSHMRCKMKTDEDYTFYRYRIMGSQEWYIMVRQVKLDSNLRNERSSR